MGNGRSKKYEGGVLLTAVFTVVVLSILLLFLAENYRIQAQFTRRTRQYYEAQIMKELFLTDYQALAENKRSKTGEVFYNQGKLSYEKKNDHLVLTVYVDDQERKFEEVIEESK
ncbi:MAG: hypothetical protein L0I89_03970 [Tetragenococcus halophilus]|uniref:competence type IV pilus minor pilin ComGG n=1 Tax=Tetragenococcus halophilus TaxID=51669 RepID=UPI001926A2BC|nr:competence type IV pilus minor pilin ComGG [Tetragenococcus halophilus]MDN6128955.1 hypothetical protein [Tetragenococcus halophilus]MDN6153115.1 hypothetical protein [Tetragenococcus halophilus]MDN6186828.1 hypothetical protein [Tetragenococcus halophilus]MDN6256900.1 hypothetical protein [Tetragenococcus halophilus]MDN6265101.1 hypothetical protein [Tetragenococcus halophilus]